MSGRNRVEGPNEQIERNVRRRYINDFDVALLPQWASQALPSPCKSELEALCRALETALMRQGGERLREEVEVDLLGQIQRTIFPSKAEDIKEACGRQHISPLHVVASSRTGHYDNILAALLQKCPAMAMLRASQEGVYSPKGSTPCERLWVKFLEDRKNRVALCRAGKVGRKLLEDNCDLRSFLIRLDMLLQATEAVQGCKNRMKLNSCCGCESKIFSPRVLEVATHEIVSRTLEWHHELGVDNDLFYLLINLFPEQEVAQPSSSSKKTWVIEATNRSFYPPRKAFPIYQTVLDPTICADVIADALRAQPSLAYCCNDSGRTILAFAIESGRNWSDGLRSIAMAAPGCLNKQDSETGLFPFMLAACKKKGKGEANLDISTIFGLLRACPCQVEMGTPPSPTMVAQISPQSQKPDH